MKNTKKRGFTIVELVIVIAVIAILAAVLIPTFSNVIQKANESNALQSARNAWTAYQAENPTTFSNKAGYIKSGDYWFAIENGQFKTAVVSAPASTTGYTEVKYVAANSTSNPTVLEANAFLKGNNCVIYVK